MPHIAVAAILAWYAESLLGNPLKCFLQWASTSAWRRSILYGPRSGGMLSSHVCRTCFSSHVMSGGRRIGSIGMSRSRSTSNDLWDANHMKHDGNRHGSLNTKLTPDLRLGVDPESWSQTARPTNARLSGVLQDINNVFPKVKFPPWLHPVKRWLHTPSG